MLLLRQICSETPVVVFLGDSLTEQGDGPEGYVGLLRSAIARAAPGVRVVNAGRAGDHAKHMATRLKLDALAYNPSLVCINAGINDVWHGFDESHPAGAGPRGSSLEIFLDAIDQMIEAAIDARADVLMIAPTVIEENLHSRGNQLLRPYAQGMRHAAVKHGARYVDAHAAFLEAVKSGAGPLTTDGVHLTPAGSQLLARTVAHPLDVNIE